MKTVLTELIEQIEASQQRYIDLAKADIKMKKGVDAILTATTIIKMKANNLLEKEKQQTIDFASKCQLVRDVDCEGNVTFCFDPKEQFDKTFS